MADAAKDIENLFRGMAAGVKEAGRKRNEELAKKQGYVEFQNPDAVAMFHADPYYKSWTYQLVNGKHRFYPPKKEIEAPNIVQNNSQEQTTEKQENQNIDLSQVLEDMKQKIKDPTKKYSITIQMIQETQCRYTLTATDRQTGQKIELQNFVTEFRGKFVTETIPSIYYQVTGGFPTNNLEKKDGETSHYIIEGINGMRLTFGSLNLEQLQLIKQMQRFVDEQYILKKQITEKKVNQNINLSQVLEDMKQKTKDPTKRYSITIQMIHETQCRYTLIEIDKKTEQKREIQNFVTEFNGRFVTETIPSIYYQVTGGFPTNNLEKTNGKTFHYIIEGINGMRLSFGSLNLEQLQLIKQMQKFVDDQYIFRETPSKKTK